MNQGCTRCNRAHRVSRYGNRTEAIGAKSIRSRAQPEVERPIVIRSISRKTSHGSASRRLTSPPRERERSPARKNEDKRRTLRINKPALNTEVAYTPPFFPSLEIYRMGRQAVHNAAQLKLKQGNHVKGDVSLYRSFSLSWTQFLWCRRGE